MQNQEEGIEVAGEVESTTTTCVPNHPQFDDCSTFPDAAHDDDDIMNHKSSIHADQPHYIPFVADKANAHYPLLLPSFRFVSFNYC